MARTPVAPSSSPATSPSSKAIVHHLEAALVIIDPLVAYLDRRPQRQQRSGTSAAPSPPSKRSASAPAPPSSSSATSTRRGGANPLYRGGGSIGIIGAARCGLLLARDPDDPEPPHPRRHQRQSRPAPPLPRLPPPARPRAGVTRVVWDGESPLTAAALLRPTTNREQANTLNAVRAWLRDRLAAGPRRGTDVQAEAAAAALAWPHCAGAC